MSIFLLFMFAYQIHNPVHLLESQSFSCGSPHHIIIQLRQSPPYIFLFLAGVPAILFFYLRESPPHNLFSIAGVPASYQFQLRESLPIWGCTRFNFINFIQIFPDCHTAWDTVWVTRVRGRVMQLFSKIFIPKFQSKDTA